MCVGSTMFANVWLHRHTIFEVRFIALFCKYPPKESRIHIPKKIETIRPFFLSVSLNGLSNRDLVPADKSELSFFTHAVGTKLPTESVFNPLTYIVIAIEWNLRFKSSSWINNKFNR